MIYVLTAGILTIIIRSFHQKMGKLLNVFNLHSIHESDILELLFYMINV